MENPDADINVEYDYLVDTIYWDPHSGLAIESKPLIQSASIGLAHEMGHTAQDIDNLYNHLSEYDRRERKQIEREENHNLETYENPIATQLGEATRDYYDDFKGSIKMNNSIHHFAVYKPNTKIGPIINQRSPIVEYNR